MIFILCSMVLEHEEVLVSQSLENEFFNKQYGIAMKMIKHSAILPMNNNTFFKGILLLFVRYYRGRKDNNNVPFFELNMKLMDFLIVYIDKKYKKMKVSCSNWNLKD